MFLYPYLNRVADMMVFLTTGVRHAGMSETGHHGTDPLWYRPIMVQTNYGTLAIARLLRIHFVIVT